MKTLLREHATQPLPTTNGTEPEPKRRRIPRVYVAIAASGLLAFGGSVAVAGAMVHDGKTGPAGPRGVAGFDGVSGPKGNPGPRGEVGPRGPAGPKGATGPAGAGVVAPASSGSDNGSGTPAHSTTSDGKQVFTGTGQQNLGTITVPEDATISWSCASCGNDNFIINNSDSDPDFIETNGLDQTHGVDPISAGTYHTVVVDTTSGPWTVTIG